MLPRLWTPVIIVCAKGISASIPFTCENLPLAALSQRPGRSFLTFPAFSFAKEKQKKNRGEYDWQSTIWRRRS